MAVLLATAMLGSLLAACVNNEATTQPPQNMTENETPSAGETEKKEAQEAEEADAFPVIPLDVKDASDLPDWGGKPLNLSMWFGHGPGGDIDQRVSEGDVVTPEITRITGVSLDRKNSFDNAGTNSEVKMGLLAASNNWPHLATNIDSLNQLVAADKVYDLTELLPKYAPNIMAKIPQDWKNVWGDPKVDGGQPGKIYGVPLNIRNVTIEGIQDRLARAPANPKLAIWVRDDILKMLYPHAKTRAEIEATFMEKGTFAKEEILDVAIRSPEEFYQLLRDIKALGVKEGNREVSATYVATGTDNWALMTTLFSGLYGFSGSNYFSYWDRETQKVEWMFRQPFFKEALFDFNTLVREGVASKESLIDPANTYRQKLDNGLYAVSYAAEPSKELLQQAGKDYGYRKVYLDIPFDEKKYVFPAALQQGNDNIIIFKDKVNEEDVPQILRWLDFLVSDAGEKLRYWGPRSAGLFEEQGDKLVYKDKELERHMVYNEPSALGLHYNLYNGTRESGLRFGLFSYLPDNGSRYHPTVIYDRERNIGQLHSFFNLGWAEPVKRTDTIMPYIYSFLGIPEVDSAWKARKAFEDALTKVLAASSDAEFEKLYADFLTIAEKSGYNDVSLAKIDAEYRVVNADYMNNIK